MTEETKIATTPQSELERVRNGESKTFDAPALCALLCQLLAHPDYWEDDGYLVHMQFHRDEVRTIANYMSIGIGADAQAKGVRFDTETMTAHVPTENFLGTVEHPGEPGVQLGEDALTRSDGHPAPDSAVLGEFIVGDGVAQGFAETAHPIEPGQTDRT